MARLSILALCLLLAGCHDGATATYVPAIPEPSSWITMILGLGVVGAVLRKVRRDVPC